MPFRDVPPLRRPWWEKLTGVWLAGTVVVVGDTLGLVA